MPEAITIERTIGDDIFEAMSNGLARDYYTSVLEFISNGHDAGAHRFSIVASIDQLVMEDDGTGMNKDSIHNFFTKGTDHKRVNLETDEGRRVLGRFGLASLLVRHLGDAYRLETWRDGEKIMVWQDFESDGWRKPGTEVLKSDEKTPNGTRITITKPRYQLNSDEFNLDKLRTQITYGFPPLHDFIITLNDKEVPKRGTVKYGIEYDATAKISDKVRISGSIFYNSHRGYKDKAGGRLPFDGGIVLYVGGRMVGDPKDFGLASIDGRFPGNVLGIIDVHGLSDKIRFDRSGFLRTSSYDGIREHIFRILQSMRSDLDSGAGRRDFYFARRQVKYIDQALEGAESRLNTKLKLEGKNQYAMEFDTGKRSGPIARVDYNNKVIYINQTNPQLIRTTGERSGTITENLLLMSSIVALAEYEASRGANKSLFSGLDL